MGDQTAVIKDTDVSEEMQQHAVECAILAIEKYNVEREISALIKRVNVCNILLLNAIHTRSQAGWVLLHFLEKQVLWTQGTLDSSCGLVSLCSFSHYLHVPFLIFVLQCLLFLIFFIISLSSRIGECRLASLCD